MKFISVLLLMCALTLSGVAAYYSIIGLATIFSAAFWPVVVMAAILEISKLVLASWLYHNWGQTPRLLKTYLTSAVIVLMVITSLGIFGFLSKAHVDQGLVTSEAQLRLELINSEIQTVEQIRSQYEQQLAQLDRSINIQLDANRAQGALAARRQQQTERGQIRQRLDTETARWAQLNQERTRLRQQVNVIASEVGPIRYVAQLFSPHDQVDLESAVTWMIVVIVLVFDPLAVLMIIAANMGLQRNNGTINSNQPSHEYIDTPTPEGMLKWDPDAQTWRVWSGHDWQQLPSQGTHDNPSQHDPITQEQIKQGVNDVMNSWLQQNLSVQNTVDPNLIRDTVAQTVRNIMTEIMDNKPSGSPSMEEHAVRHMGLNPKTKNI